MVSAGVDEHVDELFMKCHGWMYDHRRADDPGSPSQPIRSTSSAGAFARL